VPALRVFLLVAASAILAGCFGRSDATHVQSATPQASPAGPDADAMAEVKGRCPLTLPNERTPPDNAAGMNHGNGAMWTAMWPHNVVIAEPSYVAADGSVGMKWPWYRGVRGKLAITGHRLDASAPPLTASIPSGYGMRGFQPSGISFPTEGCWRVTGMVGGEKLTFVTLILKAARYRPLAEDG
jgi:hypothetical protein